VEKDAIPVDGEGKGVSTVDSKDDFFKELAQNQPKIKLFCSIDASMVMLIVYKVF